MIKLECLAQIDNVTYKTDACGDKVGSIKLSFIPEIETQDLINRLHQPGVNVKLIIEQNG